jgi:16S rRNA (guanine527-N7)-methyltransferase
LSACADPIWACQGTWSLLLSENHNRIAGRLDQILQESGLAPLDEGTGRRFAAYCELLLRWNARTNLTAIRDEEGILRRHFAESIGCARALPAEVRTLLDFGSGAGFPGIPIALCREEVEVTLAESQGKKAAFLREAVRTLGIRAAVHGGRAEELKGSFDCVTLRAVDRMEQAVGAAARLIRPGGWIAIMGSRASSGGWRGLLTGVFAVEGETGTAGSEDGVLLLARRELAANRSR